MRGSFSIVIEEGPLFGELGTCSGAAGTSTTGTGYSFASSTGVSPKTNLRLLELVLLLLASPVAHALGLGLPYAAVLVHPPSDFPCAAARGVGVGAPDHTGLSCTLGYVNTPGHPNAISLLLRTPEYR